MRRRPTYIYSSIKHNNTHYNRTYKTHTYIHYTHIHTLTDTHTHTHTLHTAYICYSPEMACCSGTGRVMKGSGRTAGGGVIMSSRYGRKSSTMRCGKSGEWSGVEC